MAIPFLIGGAAVVAAGTVAVILTKKNKMFADSAQSFENLDRTRKAEEVKQAEKKKEQETNLRNLEQFSFDSGKILAEKYDIEISMLGDAIFSIAGVTGVARSSVNSLLGNSVFSKELSYLAIHQPKKCKAEFINIFNHSKKVINMNNQRDYFKNEIEEINNLAVILSNMERL